MRRAELERKTSETQIKARVILNESGDGQIRTGLAFFDHMLTAFAKHAGIVVDISCQGDLEVDDHHTIEDTALVLGKVIDQALGDRSGIRRFGSAYAPLDEALARVVIDLSGRPFALVNLELSREMVGDTSSENLVHFFQSLAISLRAAIHVDVLRGTNDHHRAEAAFKALALALREAVALSGSDSIPSTKGVL